MASDKKNEFQIENISDETIRNIAYVLFMADSTEYYNKLTGETVGFNNLNEINENLIHIGRLKIVDYLKEFKKHTKEDSPLASLPDCYVEMLTQDLEYNEDFNINTVVFNEYSYFKFFEVFGDKYFEVYPEIENSFTEICKLAERSCVLNWIKENALN